MAELEGPRLRVNPIACAGRGLCAELFPERVRLDDWGYPIIDPAPVSRPLIPHGRRAVAACPTLALSLEPSRPDRRPDRSGHERGSG